MVTGKVLYNTGIPNLCCDDLEGGVEEVGGRPKRKNLSVYM